MYDVIYAMHIFYNWSKIDINENMINTFEQ